MDETPLPFDQHNVVMLVLQNQLLGSAAHKIGDDAIQRQAVAFDHDAGLARSDECELLRNASYQNSCRNDDFFFQ